MRCALQAPKSCCEIGRELSSYNSISRASRSFPRSSNLPVAWRRMRIVQKVCRLPLSAISAREVLKLACSSVYLPREFSYEFAMSYRKKCQKYLRKITKLPCIVFNSSRIKWWYFMTKLKWIIQILNISFFLKCQIYFSFYLYTKLKAETRYIYLLDFIILDLQDIY